MDDIRILPCRVAFRARLALPLSLSAMLVCVSPAWADLCSDISYVAGLKGKLASIATGPVVSAGQFNDIPGAANQRTTFHMEGSYRCGLSQPYGNGEQNYLCDFAAGGQNFWAKVGSCYPGVTPQDAGSEEKDWAIGGARIDVTDYGSGYNVNLTIWPAGDDSGDDDLPF